VNDNEAPAYMIVTHIAWKHESLLDCCWANFQWTFRECMGDRFGADGSVAPLPLGPCEAPLPEYSGQWYVEYYDDGDFECVKE